MRVPLIACLALWLCPTAVLAQQVGPPIPLVQPPAPSSAGPPPAPASAWPPPAAQPAEPSRTITGEPLTPPGVGWSGETAPAPALPRDFWHGTPRALAEILLARLPDTTSPALQALVRRLLLSPGEAPTGADPDATPVLLPGLHAAALLRLGETDAARRVIAAVPEQHRAALQPLVVEADAIEGHIDAACDKVREAIRRDQGVVWQRALIACQVVDGDADKASLGLQLLAEQGRGGQRDSDQDLAIAVDALAGRPTPAIIERLDDPDPTLLWALAAAKRRFAPGMIATLRADLALSLARDERAAAETRLLAAERAAACGALPVAQLRELYGALARAVPASGKGDGTLDRARWFAAIGEANSPAERLARIAAFADSFPAKDESLVLAARLVAPELLRVAPDATLAKAAASSARLLLAAGEYDAARRWLELDVADIAELRQVLALAVPDAAPATGKAAATTDPTLLALRVALGTPLTAADLNGLPAPAWKTLGPPASPIAPWLDLNDAASGKRIGETILAAVLVAAPHGALVSDPVAVSAAVKGLTQVGPAADARHLAVETALAQHPGPR
jgi:hypothetical protein